MSEALRLADALFECYHMSVGGPDLEAAAELRRLHDLLGKANALCRIRADRIKKLEALNAELVEALQLILNNNECLLGERVARAALAKVEASK